VSEPADSGPVVRVLPEALSNQIAAGEVVERPASVVKELVENAIDAGASRILIDVEGAGKSLIRIVDDGSGMARLDAETAVLRHATSKVKTSDDLEAIGTLGFRGEALPSIASVSRFLLVTRRSDSDAATTVAIEGGNKAVLGIAAAPVGTRIEVRDLFWNVPARLKFLKTDTTEVQHVVDLIRGFALGHPHIHFRLGTGGRSPALDLPAVRRLGERVVQVLGKDTASELFEVGITGPPIRVTGFVSSPRGAKSTPSGLTCFVNGRRVKDRVLHHALVSAFGAELGPGRFPQAVLWIHLDPKDVDVNVHPAKAEVRFREPDVVHDAVARAVQMMLRQRPWTDSKPLPLEAFNHELELAPAAEAARPSAFSNTTPFHSNTPSAPSNPAPTHSNASPSSGSPPSTGPSNTSAPSSSTSPAASSHTSFAFPNTSPSGSPPSSSSPSTASEATPEGVSSPVRPYEPDISHATHLRFGERPTALFTPDRDEDPLHRPLRPLGAPSRDVRPHRPPSFPLPRTGVSVIPPSDRSAENPTSREPARDHRHTDPTPREPTPEPSGLRPTTGPRPFRILGETRAGLILAEDDLGLIAVDRRVTDELSVLSALQRDLKPPQPLLIPARLDLAPHEAQHLAVRVDELQRLGLWVEPFGGPTFQLLGLPPASIGASPVRLLEAVSTLLSKEPDAPRGTILRTIAAVTAKTRESHRESPEQVVKLALTLTERAQDGRRPFIRLSTSEIDRRFET
jgi:DNA mismatch repair protein MutL